MAKPLNQGLSNSDAYLNLDAYVHIHLCQYVTTCEFLLTVRVSVLSFGGGPAVNHLYMCAICQVEIEALAKRRKIEIDTFIKVKACISQGVYLCIKVSSCFVLDVEWAVFSSLQLNKEFQAEEAPTVILCISMQWFREWESFVKGKDNGISLQLDKYGGALKSSLCLCKIFFIICFLRTAWSHRQQ